MSKLIPLIGKCGEGKFAIVDDEYYEAELKWRWHLSDGYARRLKSIGEGRPSEKYVWVFLHRVVAGANDGEFVDHIDGNRLNNQKRNLRPCTRSENARNSVKRLKGGTSRFKGVSIKRKRWEARIFVNKKQVRLGVFSGEEEAAQAYDAAAKKYHGEFAKLNFPDEAL